MDDFGAITFLLGLAIPFGWDAVTETGWRKWGAGALAAVFTLAAFLWGPLKAALPAVADFVTRAAGQPSSWIMLFLFAAAVVIFTGPRFQPKRIGEASELSRPLEARLNEIEEARRETDQCLLNARQELSNDVAKNLADIRKKIAIDVPNATTIAEAFRNLDDAVHAKVARISEQTQRFSDRLNRDNLDLLHLLYFALLQATERTLAHLVLIAPVRRGSEATELNVEALEANRKYLEEVASTLSGTYRHSDFRNIAMNAETEADSRLNELPREQWPTDLNPIDHRRYLIAAIQSTWTEAYILRQLQDVRNKIGLDRSRMLERYEERQKLK